MSAELVIRGGTVFDGSGAPGRAADVAISDGVIREIGPKLRGERELDASGCAVAPGFIDIHTHFDAQLCDAPLYTDLLGKWVRERSLMPLEKAVRKLSGEAADLFGFVRRGYLRENYWADVCVFDPLTVGPGPLRRVRDFPADAERLTADQPTGVRHVLVNGTPIRTDGRSLIDSLERRPGTRPEIA